MGRKKIKLGRKRIDEELQIRRNITLSDQLADKAIQIGGGISSGIRKALNEYKL